MCGGVWSNKKEKGILGWYSDDLHPTVIDLACVAGSGYRFRVKGWAGANAKGRQILPP